MKQFVISISLVLFTPLLAFSQTTSQNRFVSSLDQSLTIKRVSIAPFTDNVSDIYAKALDKRVRNLMDQDKQWAQVEFPTAMKANYRVGYFEDKSRFAEFNKATNVDALITGHLVKGTKGIQIEIKLYSTRDSTVLALSELRNFQGFEIKDVENEVDKLFASLKESLPYRALVLSRRGNQVTVNLGQNYGLKENDELTVVQFLKLNRHPRQQFIVSSEKEVLGRIQLFKVDKFLSFGQVIYERETGVIQPDSKVLPLEFKKYPTPVLGPDGKLINELEQRKDAPIAFGKNPGEWTPEPPPQFGKVGVLLGLGQLQHSTTLGNSGGSLSTDDSLVPDIKVHGELWFSPQWQAAWHLLQSVFNLTNDLSGSSPTELNGSLEQYGLSLQYNILLNQEFFGPRWQVGFGFTQSKFTVDESTPLAYTDHNYGGLHLDLGGSFPVSDEYPISLGAQFQYYLTKTLSEGVSSGGGAEAINTFSFFGEYQASLKYRVRAELLFEYFSADLGGTGPRTYPAESSSHRLTTLFFGLDYLF